MEPARKLGSSRVRLEAIDVVRGVIMIVMALDHTRDFFGIPGQSPTDLAHASAALFLTRWITYFCAPVFFLLTGTGAYLSLRKKSPGELSRFLLTRGLWLIFLELVVARCLAYQLNVDYKLTMLLVLWALGLAMITLAALVRLPAAVVTGFGVLLIAGHNLLDGVRSAAPLWAILHAPGFVLNTPPARGIRGLSADPLDRRHRGGLRPRPGLRLGGRAPAGLPPAPGGGLSLAFVILRGLDGYGDPSRWTPQKSALFTALSFLSTTKYPPSLLFLLMTLGPALILLALVDRGTPRLLRPALVIGKVPLFYYLLHFLLIHLLAVATCAVRYGSAHWMFESPDLANYPFTAPPGWGYSLPVVYGIWAFVVIAMYPLCRWFAALKARRGDAWLSYL